MIALIRVYDAAGNVIETQEQTGHFKEWSGAANGGIRRRNNEFFRYQRTIVDSKIETCIRAGNNYK